MICPNCSRETGTIKTVIARGEITTGCPKCSGVVKGNPQNAKHQREWQKKEYRRDLVQPTDPRQMIKAYGVEKAREYYSEETIRKFG